MKILILDNYDSFTYNIVHAVRETGYAPDVVRNDMIPIEEVGKFDKIIISPGPGIPSEAGILKELLEHYAETKPILGICLGHQAIGERFGAKLVNLPEVYHGVQTSVRQLGDDYIFNGFEAEFPVGRYHSWVVDGNTLPECIEVTAYDDAGMVMALRHRTLDVHGVQFHPESILTPDGTRIIDNFLKH